MRFGHYTVFDTPEENKHTQVYVEYDVPNNDNLTGATGTIVLTEGGQGSGGGGGDDTKHGIESITISPEVTTTPALDTVFPIYYEDLTDEQKDQGVNVEVEAASELSEGFSYTITPTSDWYAVCTTVNPSIVGEQGEPIVVTGEYSCTLVIANGLDPEAEDFIAFEVRFYVVD